MPARGSAECPLSVDQLRRVLQLTTQMKTVVVQVLSHSDEEEFHFLGAPPERSGKESHGNPLKSGPELSCGVLVLAAFVSRRWGAAHRGGRLLLPLIAGLAASYPKGR